MNIWNKLEVSGIFENAWAHLGMLRNPWRCLRTLRNTQECAGLYVEAVGAVRSTQLQFWVPHENDQPSLGIVKTHLESFGRVWHAQEYEGMHCCCAWLRMSRFPFPCCTGFWWILGPPLETILDHFFIFSLIWAVQNHIWIAVTFFLDFGIEILVKSDVLTLQKYYKYMCFH